MSTLLETASVLPAPYSHGDIGVAATVGLPGSASYYSTSHTYTLNGAGTDIGSTADGFQFAYTTLTGNGSCIVDVTSMANFATNGKAGIMMRSSLDPSAAFVDDFLSQNTSVESDYRAAVGNSTSTNAISSSGFSTAWVELTRSGNSFSAYYGTNGTTWTFLGSQTVTMGTTIYVGMVTSSHSSSHLATATFAQASLTGTLDQPPTIATAAAASPTTVTGRTTTLSVLGADNSGESTLSYVWSALSVPAGATVTFSANGTNASKSTLATFDMAGIYNLVATIIDFGGLTVTSSVSVTVSQVLSSIVVTPTYTSMGASLQQQFTATGCDQFGAPMTSPPTVSWSVASGGGSINSSGLYTSPSGTGSASIVATSAAASGERKRCL